MYWKFPEQTDDLQRYSMFLVRSWFHFNRISITAPRLCHADETYNRDETAVQGCHDAGHLALRMHNVVAMQICTVGMV